MRRSGSLDAAQRIRDLERALAESKSQRNASEKENQGLKRKLEAKDAKLTQLRDEKRKSQDMHKKRRSREAQQAPCWTLEDGTRAPLIEIQLGQLPTRNLARRTAQQADGSHEKGRRDYLPVLDQIVEATQGQTQARRVGGWGYRFIDKLRHYDHTRTLAQTAQCGIGQALERDYINRSRTGTVRVLPRPLSGTNYRRQLDPVREGKIRIYFRPSQQTMHDRVIPAMTFALLKAARKKMELATRIAVNFDGTNFGRYHILGVLMNFVYFECVSTDPFGNQTRTIRIERMPLLLQQLVNKLGKRVRKGMTGEFWSPETPRAVCDAIVFSGLQPLVSDDEIVIKTSYVSDGARDNVGCSPDDHPDTDALCGQNSPIHAIYLTGDAPAESYERLQASGLGEDLPQFYAGKNLDELTEKLRKERLMDRRQRDQELLGKKVAADAGAGASAEHSEGPNPPSLSPGRSADEPNEASLLLSIEPEGASVAGLESTAALADAAPKPHAAPGERVEAPSPMDAAGAEAPGAQPTYQTPPPERRRPPPAIDRSGPVLRCRERALWLRSYAEGKLRAWWPSILAMRWAWGWWRARSAAGKSEIWRIRSIPARSAARQTKFIAKMQKWIVDRHTQWCEEQLGGEMGEVEWEHVGEDGDVLETGAYIVPKLTDKEFKGCRLSVFCSRRPVRGRGSSEFEKVEILRHNASNMKIPKFHLFLRKLSDGLVSMKLNPLRYYAGRDQRVNPANETIARFRRIANAYFCLFHNIHNASKHQFLMMNVGFASQIISATNVISSDFVRPFLEDAVKHLLDTRPDGINSATTFWDRFRAEIEAQFQRGEGVSLQEAMQETGHDWSLGLPECITVRELRWGTLHKVALFLLFSVRFLLLGLMKRFGHAFREKDELNALLTCFSHGGFDPYKHPKFRMEGHVKNTFALLTLASNRAQLAIVCALESLFLEPLFAASSAKKGCAASTMMGLNSVPRNLLLIWSRAIFVDTAQNGKAWDKRVTVGHRNDGSEFGRAHTSMRVLNPNCGCKVNGLLGDFGNKHSMNAIRNLVSEFKKIASLSGSVLPADIRMAYDAAHKTKNPKLYAEDEETRNLASNSVAVKMSQLQWFFCLIAEDVTSTIRTYFEPQLYCLEGFLAGIGKQLSTKSVPCLDEIESTLAWDQTFTYADPWAQANAVILLILGEELHETLAPQLKVPGLPIRRDLEDFFPPIVAVFGKSGREELLDFLGLTKERWGERFDRLEDLPLVVFNGETGERAYDVHGRSLFPWTVSRSDKRFSVLDSCFVYAYTTITDSKSMEQWFSPIAHTMRARGNSGMLTVNGYMFRNAWDSANEDPMAVPQAVYHAAEEIAQKDGWLKAFLGADSSKRELMRKDDQRTKMPVYIKNGGDWKETNTQGDGRTNKFLHPKAKSDVARALQSLVNSVCDREGQPRKVVNAPAKPKSAQPSSAAKPQTNQPSSAAKPVDPAEAAAADMPSINGRKRKSKSNGINSEDGEVNSEDVLFNECDDANEVIDAFASDTDGGRLNQMEPMSSAPRFEGQGDGGEDLEQIKESDGLNLADPAQTDGSAEIRDSLSEQVPDTDGENGASDEDLPIAAVARLRAASGHRAFSNNEKLMSDVATPEHGPVGKENSSTLSDTAAREHGVVGIDNSSTSLPAPDQPSEGSCSLPGVHRDTEVTPPGRTGEWDEDVDGNIWTYQFVLDVAYQLGFDAAGFKADVWQKSNVVYSKERWGDSFRHCATITRLFKQRKKLCIDPISFKVETMTGQSNPKHFFIAFDKYASRCIVDIFEISEPSLQKGKPKHDKTMRFRRVWTAMEGSTRTDSEEDTQNGHLGSKSLRRIAEENASKGEETYHVGDVGYYGDLRSLIGVIKWYPQSYQNAHKLPSGYFQLYSRADSIRVGSHFSQKPNC